MDDCRGGKFKGMWKWIQGNNAWKDPRARGGGFKGTMWGWISRVWGGFKGMWGWIQGQRGWIQGQRGWIQGHMGVDARPEGVDSRAEGVDSRAYEGGFKVRGSGLEDAIEDCT
jgi:hypothetical protein